MTRRCLQERQVSVMRFGCLRVIVIVSVSVSVSVVVSVIFKDWLSRESDQLTLGCSCGQIIVPSRASERLKWNDAALSYARATGILSP